MTALPPSGGRHRIEQAAERRPELGGHAYGSAGRGYGQHLDAERREGIPLGLPPGIGTAVVAGCRHEDEIIETHDQVGIEDFLL
jgi:hypothetical protein